MADNREWQTLSKRSGGSGEYDYEIEVRVKFDRMIGTEADRSLSYRVGDMIHDSLLRESIRLNPESHVRASKEREEILAAFTSPIFVEEIPNGYCSQYCCEHLPWFVVTTEAGRIKVGWRKSVLHLEWTDSAIKGTADEIFPKEEAWPGYETTSYGKIIHAHGLKALYGYIERLMAAWRTQESEKTQAR